MYYHAIHTSTIDRICHYYLEQGHTQNEGDSMHSTIEAAAKNVNVFSPMQCHTVAGTAKETGECYTVVETDGKMKDFATLTDMYLKGKQRGLKWNEIKLTKIILTRYSSRQVSLLKMMTKFVFLAKGRLE